MRLVPQDRTSAGALRVVAVFEMPGPLNEMCIQWREGGRSSNSTSAAHSPVI